MTNTPYHDLAARIEAADGPDRALDAEIHALLNPGDRWVIGHEPGRFPQTPIYGTLTDAINSFADKREAGDFINAPRYTASLDAAMTLVPEGWRWMLRTSDDGSVWFAEVWTFGVLDLEYLGCSTTPSQALAAACLRARSS